MRETKEHTDAFNEYYLMGDGRSLKLLACNHDVTEQTMKRWSIAHNWQDRIEIRDIEASKKLIEQVDKAVVNTRADYRKDIRLTLQPVKAALNTVIVKGEDGKPQVNIKIETAKDFSLMVGALEKLVKLDMGLMGEPVEAVAVQVGIGVGELSDAEQQIIFAGIARRRRDRS